MKNLFKNYVLLILIILIINNIAFSQLSSVGSPTVKNYTPENYLAAPENYAIVQDKLGIMYFGNYGYILEYDGVEWRKIEVKQYMPVISMDIDSLGRIYVSSGNEFGYLASDKFGRLTYHSLSVLLEKAETQVDGVGKVHVAKDGVFYQTATNIYKYPFVTEANRTKLTEFKKNQNWTTDTRYLNSFLVQVQAEEKFFVVDDRKGIFSLENGQFELFKYSDSFIEGKNIVSMLSPAMRKQVFVGTEKDGLWYYAQGYKPGLFHSSTNKDLSEITLLCAAELPDYYVFSTLNKGTMVINRTRDTKTYEKRSVIEHYNKQSGMLSEQITEIYNNQGHDKDMLWFTSKYGISKTKINSSLRRLSEADNTKDIILDIKRFDDLLYARTLGKIYYLKDTLDEYNLRSVENISASSDWIIFQVEEVEMVKTTKKVTSVNSQKKKFGKSKKVSTTKTISVTKPKTKPVTKIFASSKFGMYEITDNVGAIVNFNHEVTPEYKLNDVANAASKYSINKIYRSKKNSNRIYLGLSDGLAVVSYQHGRWIDEGRIPSVTEDISSIGEDALGNIWLGVKNNGLLYLELPKKTITTKLKAIYAEDGDSITFDLLPTSEFQVKKYHKDKDIPGMIENGIMEYQGKLFYSTIEGLYFLNEKTKKFEIYKEFHFENQQTRVLSLSEDKNGNVWLLIQTAFSSEVLFYKKDEKGKLIYDKNALALLPDMTLRAIFPEDNGLVWISGTGGVFSYDLNKNKDQIDAFSTLIRKVSINGDSVLFWGNAYSGTANYKNQFDKIELEFRGNNIKFNFAAPFFDEENAIEYSYYLEGSEKDWSPWSKETMREYMNLPKGNYVFHVRAKNIYGTISKEAIFEFKVKTPWHEQWWAYALELTLFLLLLFLSVLFNRLQKVKSSKLTSILTMITVTAIFKLLAGLVFGPIIDHFARDIFAVQIIMNIIVGALLFPTWSMFTRLIQTGSFREPVTLASVNSVVPDSDVSSDTDL